MRKPQIGDTVALKPGAVFANDKRYEGVVVDVADDGRIMAEFRQPPHPPMTVTSNPADFLVVGPDAMRSGYQQAVATLLDVAERTGSPAARWAAEYLTADPDRRAPGATRPNLLCERCGLAVRWIETGLIEEAFTGKAVALTHVDVKASVKAIGHHAPQLDETTAVPSSSAHHGGPGSANQRGGTDGIHREGSEAGRADRAAPGAGEDGRGVYREGDRGSVPREEGEDVAPPTPGGDANCITCGTPAYRSPEARETFHRDYEAAYVRAGEHPALLPGGDAAKPTSPRLCSLCDQPFGPTEVAANPPGTTDVVHVCCWYGGCEHPRRITGSQPTSSSGGGC